MIYFNKKYYKTPKGHRATFNIDESFSRISTQEFFESSMRQINVRARVEKMIFQKGKLVLCLIHITKGAQITQPFF